MNNKNQPVKCKVHIRAKKKKRCKTQPTNATGIEA
jgi:hypothetical protein